MSREAEATSEGEGRRTAEERAALEERRSGDTVRRHAGATDGQPSLLMYSTCDPANGGEAASPAGPRRPSSAAVGSKSRPKAHHVPANAPRGTPFETSNFIGEAVVMHAPAGAAEGNAEDAVGYHYWRHFQGRRRLWELRIQGRFKRKPEGELFVGIMLRDFNYEQAVARYSQAVKRLGLLFVKWKFYLSWGDRCEAAKQPDAELSHLVTGLAGLDQIVVTPGGESPPPLTEELCGLGIERKKLGYDKYKQEVGDVVDAINTEDTYTFCYWGPSPFIDAVQWQFRFGTVIPMAQFLEEWPLHFVMYELDKEAAGTANSRQLESQKRYFLDFMFWSTTQEDITRNLPSRYAFQDAPGTLEAETAQAAKAAAVAAEAARADLLGTLDRSVAGDVDLVDVKAADQGAGPAVSCDASGGPGAPVMALLQRLRGLRGGGACASFASEEGSGATASTRESSSSTTTSDAGCGSGSEAAAEASNDKSIWSRSRG